MNKQEEKGLIEKKSWACEVEQKKNVTGFLKRKGWSYLKRMLKGLS